MSDFAGALRALMTERGMSGNALARLVPCDRALICRYRRGKQQPSRRMAQLLDDALGAGGGLAALARPTPTRRAVLAGSLLAGSLLGLTPDAVERLAWAERHPPRIDAAVVDSLAAMLAAQVQADNALGSAVTLRPVLAQLTAIENLVSQAREPLRRAPLSVAQQWAQHAACKHRQIGDDAGDRARLAQALEWATETGDRTMTATILVNRGEAALLRGEPGTVIGPAQAVQHDAAAAAGPRAHAADLEARGHALASDPAAAERCLDRAAGLTAELGPRDDRHPWLYWMSPTDMRCKRGVSFGFLAGDPRYHDRAVAELQAGYAALPAPVQTAAWGAKYPAYLAVVHERAGDVTAACAMATQAANIARRTGPSLAQRLARQVHANLAARYPRDPSVTTLGDTLRAA